MSLYTQALNCNPRALCDALERERERGEDILRAHIDDARAEARGLLAVSVPTCSMVLVDEGLPTEDWATELLCLAAHATLQPQSHAVQAQVIGEMVLAKIEELVTQRGERIGRGRYHEAEE